MLHKNRTDMQQTYGWFKARDVLEKNIPVTFVLCDILATEAIGEIQFKNLCVDLGFLSILGHIFQFNIQFTKAHEIIDLGKMF